MQTTICPSRLRSSFLISTSRLSTRAYWQPQTCQVLRGTLRSSARATAYVLPKHEVVGAERTACIAKVSVVGRQVQWREYALSSRPKLDPSIERTERIGAEADNEVKVVTAYCAAEQYRIAEAAEILHRAGYVLDPSATGLYPQVLHIRLTPSTYYDVATSPGDIFVFPSGVVVAWNVTGITMTNLISGVLMPAADNGQKGILETEDLLYSEDSNSHKSRMRGDRIEIGIKPNPELVSNASPTTMTHSAATHEQDPHQHDTDTTLAKIAFSSGLARSVKLAVLENNLEAYFHSTRTIPDLMARGSKIPFSRHFIIRKTGELLKLRAQLNLSSELTDSLPDMFWDSKYELGLERYFEQVGRALDVNVRSKVLNQKMDYAQEIVTVLREQLSERHGLTLEWLIIGLIAIEVLFEIHRVVREHWDGLARLFKGNVPESEEPEDG